jgi:hypothetical protein
MSPLGMKMDDIIDFFANQSAERGGGEKIESVADGKRPEPHVEFSAIGV